WAVGAADVRDAPCVPRWPSVIIGGGGVFCDAALFANAHRATVADAAALLRAAAELAVALAPAKERPLETTGQGRAFVEAARAAWPCAALERLGDAWDGPIAYPVALAVTPAGHSLPPAPAL